ncbi:hypothetical protein DLAC_07880 [Tieghemostelium lacteum]|uniref:Paramecium surface antigen repeat-containing protein n=1 Tax=Tieghemostelium lacteum TaxID=361077 RepID=A0A151ZAM0_TIELA|nr:hypothetical protein DLAC_07880 [Tieghemostelium lacteum]|eukprot:KYQ90990.1 hypothetical protein DLAC_07880 [Tieghemostelium lacteum]
MKIIVLAVTLLFTIAAVNAALNVCVDEYCGVTGAPCGHHGACALNYYCSEHNEQCEPSKGEDEICKSDKECLAGLKCINYGSNSLCKPKQTRHVYESCDEDYQCVGSLQCIGGACKTHTFRQCKYHEDCQSNWHCKEGECRLRIEPGKKCHFVNDLCTFGNVCAYNSTGYSEEGICMKAFSKSYGQSCYAQFGECNMADGLICSSRNGRTGSCSIPNESMYKCRDSTECDALWSVCECETGEKASDAYCKLKFNINEQCEKSYLQYLKCAETNGCAVDHDFTKAHQLHPESCLMTKCAMETSCFYSQCLSDEYQCGLPETMSKCPSSNVITIPPRTGGHKHNHTLDIERNEEKLNPKNDPNSELYKRPTPSPLPSATPESAQKENESSNIASSSTIKSLFIPLLLLLTTCLLF